MQQDFLQRFMFEDFPARGAFIRLQESWQAIQRNSPYPPVISALLGKSLAAAGLLTSNLKFSGSLSLQIQSSGALRLVLAQCSDQGDLRGVARYQENLDTQAPLESLLRQPVLAINLEPAGNGRPYQGVVPFDQGSLSRAVEAYFDRSEQLATRLWLGVNSHSTAGLLLQKMPDSSIAEEDWTRVCMMADTLQQEELLTLSTADLLHRLFNQEDLRLFKPAPYRFRCSCSREKVAGMLQRLGEEEIRAALVQTDPIEVTCEYCNQAYRFDAMDVAQLFSQNSVPPPASRQTQ